METNLIEPELLAVCLRLLIAVMDLLRVAVEKGNSARKEPSGSARKSNAT